MVNDQEKPAAALAPAFARMPGHLIRRAQQVHTMLWAARLSGDLTGPQYAVMVSLTREPLIAQTRLGELASLDKNTVTDIVTRLEERGWVERVADETDGRSYRLRLCRSARTALRKITPRVELVQSDLLEPVPQDARSVVVGFLARVAYGGSVSLEMPPAQDLPILFLPTAPGYLLRRAERLHGALWMALVGSELTPSQFAVLRALAHRPGIDQTTLGAIASLDKSSTADIVARLARAGFVVRDPASSGRRKSLLLTTRAKSVLRRIAPSVDEVQTQLLKPLGAEERVGFVAGLGRIAYRGDMPLTDDRSQNSLGS